MVCVVRPGLVTIVRISSVGFSVEINVSVAVREIGWGVFVYNCRSSRGLI